MVATRYEVRAVGMLPASARSEFAELEVELHPVETVLHGPVGNSAALVALLARLATLGLNVVEFHRLTAGPTEPLQPSPPLSHAR